MRGRLIVGALALALLSGEAQAAPPPMPPMNAKDQMIARQCPSYVPDTQAMMTAFGTMDRPDLADELDRTIAKCKAAPHGMEAIDHLIANLKTCQSGGAVGLEGQIQGFLRLRAGLTESMTSMCR